MVLGKVLVISRKNEIHQLARSVASEVLVADDAAEANDIIAGAIAGASPDLFIFDGAVGENEIKSFLTTTDPPRRKATGEPSQQADNNRCVPVIIIGESENKPGWLSALTYYYLPNPNDLVGLQEIISKISDSGLVSRDSQYEQQKNTSDESRVTSHEFFIDELAASVSMAGKSRSLHHTLKMLRIVAESNCNPILITGETGTGKEPAAKAVHLLRNPKENFVAVNCAALTANLLESELFGHVKGAFTSADKDKTGLLELACAGSIFLDEISEIPLELQAKLLRVLQEKTFRKVGGVTDIGFEATIIASSNRDLRREVRENRFRPDLYYRLNICPVHIAPLRDQHRIQDIRLLANYFLKTSTVSPAKIGKITAFTELAMQKIEQYCWPGNVRELRNVIERAILLETTDKIGLSSIHIEPLDLLDNEIADCGLQVADCNKIRNPQSEIRNPLDFSLEKAERELIARALQESGWQKTKAAALLGITRATLYAKVKQHNIQKGVYIPRTIAVS